MQLRGGAGKMRTGCSCGSGSVSVSSRIICLHIYLHMRASCVRNGRAIVSPQIESNGSYSLIGCGIGRICMCTSL